MAFSDEIICTGKDKTTTIIMVDTRTSVGGHWNDAYDFVKMHQPAAYYGVNSEVLGSGGTDLASKYQILAYFEKVLKKLEGTGQLKFYPQCRYNGEGRFTSVLDPWMQNRDTLQVSEIPNFIDMWFSIMPGFEDGGDAYKKLEQAGFFMRLDPSVWPTKQKCATVSSSELRQLQTVTSVVRQGRVAALHLDKVEFQNGTSLVSNSDWLFVDCTCDGLATTPSVPIFQEKKLVLQPVSTCQQVKSAASIAALELRIDDNEKKNKILIPVPHPNHNRDFFVSQLQSVENDNRMAKEGAGFIWEKTSRLNLLYHIGLWDQAKLMVTLARRGKLFEDTLKKLIKNSNRDCNNE